MAINNLNLFYRTAGYTLIALKCVFLLSCQGRSGYTEPSNEFILQTKIEVGQLTNSSELQDYLESILLLDQKYRNLEINIVKEFGPDTDEYEDIWYMINKTDAENLVRIEAVFDKFGYPNIDSVGRTASHAPFLVVHHSSYYEPRLKHFSTFYKAYEDNNIKGGILEFYLDRMYHMKFNDSFIMEGNYRIEDKIDTMIVLLNLEDRIR